MVDLVPCVRCAGIRLQQEEVGGQGIRKGDWQRQSLF